MILMAKQGPQSQIALSDMIGCSDKSIHKWREQYQSGGIILLLGDKRGGFKAGKITPEVDKQLGARLKDPRGSLRRYGEILQWLWMNLVSGLNITAINMYVKRYYGTRLNGTRLKVSRKSHVQKSPSDEAFF